MPDNTPIVPNPVPAAEIMERIAKLQQYLEPENLSAFILQNTDLFYFTGTMQQGALYVPPTGDPLLLIKKSAERARRESPLPDIEEFRRSSEIPEIIRRRGYHNPTRLGLELDVLPVNLYFQYQEIFSGAVIVDISLPIRKIRSIKSAYEISVLRQAAKFSDQLNVYMKEILKEGVTEAALAGQIEGRARELGHQGIVRMRLWGAEMFYGHLMAGAGAAEPSFLASPTGGTGLNPSIAQGCSLRPIQRYEPILFDYTFAWNGYISDETRIYAIGGLDDDLRRAHEAMLALQAQLKTMAKPGTPAGDLYRAALSYVQQHGYDQHFMGAESQKIQFIGHGVGLELDEFPFIAKGQTMTLEPGMVFALEPKLIFPGKGVVGIENTYLLTDSGVEPLTLFEEGVIIV